MNKILVIGRNSFLAKRLVAYAPHDHYRLASHGDLGTPGLFDSVDCVINCALHPDYAREQYDPRIDIDRTIAEYIAGTSIHYVMLSSRKVYAPQNGMKIKESARTCGSDPYGINKVTTEKLLQQRLGSCLTICRLGNIIGFEDDANRSTFMARLLRSLKTESRVVLDVSPFARRDFITDKRFALALHKIACARPPGVFNIASGIGVEIGRIALWVIEGYGQGKLVVTAPDVRDEFVLDIAKIRLPFGLNCDIDDIRTHCIEIGQRLARA